MKIYVASKTRHAEKWKALRAAGVPINSTWIDKAVDKASPSLSDLWIRCVSEAAEADALIIYADHGGGREILKGAFIEAGAALASGRPVYTIGLQDSDGSWVNHPLVTRCDSVEQALRLINAKG